MRMPAQTNRSIEFVEKLVAARDNPNLYADLVTLSTQYVEKREWQKARTVTTKMLAVAEGAETGCVEITPVDVEKYLKYRRSNRGLLVACMLLSGVASILLISICSQVAGSFCRAIDSLF